MFELEKISIVKEYEPLIKEVIANNEAEIKFVLSNADSRLGEGRTANVCFLEANTKVCLKIYKKEENITGADFYLPAAKEMSFLDKLQGLDAKVRIPKAYACFEDDEKQNSDFLMMEALSAVSVDDILQGRADLPANFDLASFRNDMIDFVQKMHKAGVYHRDLHEGNIMIDKETGQIYVIDFGAASEFYGEPDPGERGPYSIMKNGVERKLTSDESMVKSVVKKLSLTIVN
jgi:serine/threonine protein kinase